MNKFKTGSAFLRIRKSLSLPIIAIVTVALGYGAYAVDQQLTKWEPQATATIVPVTGETEFALNSEFCEGQPTAKTFASTPGSPTAEMTFQAPPILIPDSDAIVDPVDSFSMLDNYEKQLLRSPEDNATRFRLAKMLMNLGENDKAVEQFEKTTKAPLLAGESWFELARINAKKGNVEDVVSCLRNAEEAGFHDLVGLLADPDLSAMQSHSQLDRFKHRTQIRTEEPTSTSHGDREHVTYRIGVDGMFKAIISTLNSFLMQ